MQVRVSYKKKYLKNNFFPILKVAEEGSEEYSERLSDMAMGHKILCGQGSLRVVWSQWFKRAADRVRVTQSTGNFFNLKNEAGPPGILQKFFQQQNCD